MAAHIITFFTKVIITLLSVPSILTAAPYLFQIDINVEPTLVLTLNLVGDVDFLGRLFDVSVSLIIGLGLCGLFLVCRLVVSAELI